MEYNEYVGTSRAIGFDIENQGGQDAFRCKKCGIYTTPAGGLGDGEHYEGTLDVLRAHHSSCLGNAAG